MPKVGVIILNYNTAKDTIECVNSIVNTSSNLEIVVVDNCSSDNSLDEIRVAFEGYDNVHIQVSDKNGGYSYGNNIGIYKAI